MPSSIIRRSQGLVPMTDYPLGRAGSYRPDEPVISPASFGAIGVEIGTSVALAISGTYPAANRALGYMFTLCDYYLVRKVWWVNGTTATTDSADVGVYNEAGTTLLVSGGSTAIATANVVQEKDVTDTLLAPGRYWCVYNQNGVTATPYSWSISANQQRAWGCAQFAGAVPLGSTFTPAAVVGTIFPHFGIANRTQVA
jgi:hypothetical protein